MTFKLIVLFLSPFLSGLLVFFVPAGNRKSYKLLLVFAGSYLFAITVIHIMPEIFAQSGEEHLAGMFVLAGFFLQQLLEYFSSGIEHGHIHTHEHHGHRHVSSYMLLLALCIHAFLEGAMLAQPSTGAVYDVNAILIGIVLHRMPAAFALMTVLAFQLGGKKKALPHLTVFSFAAPIGLLLSSYLASQSLISDSGLFYLYALVCGNFLHISTTIVFESSPDHHFNAWKLGVSLVGAIAAVMVEFLT